MNTFWKYFSMILQLVPAVAPVVQAVEILHSGKSGADKKAAALAIVNTAGSVAAQVAPSSAPEAQIATQAAGAAIDIAVQALKEAGALGAKPQVQQAAPVQR